MCTNPLLIRNVGYKFDVPYSKPFVSVPCGKCPECRDHINNEYAFRASMHTDYVTKHNGSVFFLTLTYKDASLPIIRWENKRGEIAQCSTWNKFHIQRAFHELRALYARYFGGVQIQYFVVTERGSAKNYFTTSGHSRLGTRRPHYHAIVWLTPTDKTTKFVGTPQEFNNLLKGCIGNSAFDAFPYFMRQAYPHGSIDIKNLNRSPHSATKYICKYMGKSEKDITQLIPFDRIVFHSCQRDMFNKKLFNHGTFRPFKLISRNVGASFVPTPAQLSGEQKVSFDGREFDLPRYYRKRTFNTLDKYYARPADIVTINPTWTMNGTTEKERYRQVYVPNYGYCRNGDISQPIAPDELRYSTKTIDTDVGLVNLEKRYINSVQHYAHSLCDCVKNYTLYEEYIITYLEASKNSVFKDYFSKYVVDLSLYSKNMWDGYPLSEIAGNLQVDYDTMCEYVHISLHHGKPTKWYHLLTQFYERSNACRMALKSLQNHVKYKSHLKEMLSKKPELFTTIYETEQLPKLECT